ncbi:uncharacterized protein [Ambystoma mexicanum]|uniref:uncharacterized protein n=1 Tax=Ambystoma mexicanum TaxID=8296 RepID=UPI0037E97942
MQATGSFDDKILLNEVFCRAIWGWGTRTHLAAGTDFQTPAHQETVTTDSSLEGWGAHTGDLHARVLWLTEERALHINVLELRAVFWALKSFLLSLKGKVVRIFTDNATTMFYIRKQGGTRSPALSKETQDLWHWAVAQGMFLVPFHLAGIKNTIADSLSRELRWCHEWELRQDQVDRLFQRWGNPEICSRRRRTPSARGSPARFPSRGAWAMLSRSPGTACSCMRSPRCRCCCDSSPTQEVPVQDDPRRTSVAEADLVPGPSGLVRVPSSQAADGHRPPLPRRRRHPSSRPGVVELAPAALEFGGHDIPADCKEVLANARVSSNIRCFGHKRKRFSGAVHRRLTLCELRPLKCCRTCCRWPRRG